MSTFTKMPNEIFEALPEMSGGEAKLTMVLARETFGFHRNTRDLTYSEMQEKTGMSRPAVAAAVKDVISRGFFTRDGSTWAVKKVNHERLENLTASVKKVNRIGKESLPPTSGPKETLKERFKETTKESGGGVDFGEVVRTYENEINMITPMAGDQLQEAFDEFGGQWVIDAIGEAVKQNVRKWSYIAAILRRWKNEGRGDAKRNEVAIAVDGGFYG